MEHTAWTPPSTEDLQNLLPQFEIQEMLGAGGMGAVFKARQPSLDRLVAIKILASSLIDEDDPTGAESFKTEARALARLSHPAIVGVHDLGQAGEGSGSLLYFVMEYVDGMDLHGWLQSEGGRIEAKAATAILSHVSEALGYAHEKGIIHGDIKPANIMLNLEGQVKIADFGLARFAAEPAEDTGPAMGTPAYSPPEAFDPETPIDHRADLFAAGVMLYELVTGNAPEAGCPLASDVAEDVGPEIDAIIDRAMKPDREDRYQSAAELRADVLAARSGSKPTKTAKGANPPRAGAALNTGGPVSVPKVRKNSGIGSLIGTVGILALLGGGGYIGYTKLQEKSANQPTKKAETSVESTIDSPPSVAPPSSVESVFLDGDGDIIVGTPAPEIEVTSSVPQTAPEPAPNPVEPEEPTAPPKADETLLKIASIRENHLKLIAEQLNPPFEQAVSSLGENYANALQKPAEALSASGNQDIAALYHAEQALVRSGEIPPTDASDGAPDRIVEMRELYHGTYSEYVAKRTEALPPLIAAWDEELAELETSLGEDTSAIDKVAHARRSLENEDPFNMGAKAEADSPSSQTTTQSAPIRNADAPSSTPVTRPQLGSPPFSLPDPSTMPTGRVHVVGTWLRDGNEEPVLNLGDRDDIVQISASGDSGGRWLALSSSGEVIAPEDEHPSWQPPSDLESCVAINVGMHNLAIEADGSLRTWHEDPSRLPPTPLGDVYLADTSLNSGIALHLDGGISFWGKMYQGRNGEALSPEGEWVRDVSAVTASQNGVVVLYKDGRASTWRAFKGSLPYKDLGGTGPFVAADGSNVGTGKCLYLDRNGNAQEANKKFGWGDLVKICFDSELAAGITTEGRISLRPGDEKFFNDDALAEIAAARNVVDIAVAGQTNFSFLTWIEQN